VTIGPWGNPALHLAIFSDLLSQAGIPHDLLPDGVRLTRRGGLTYLFNFNPHQAEVAEEAIPPHTVVIREGVDG